MTSIVIPDLPARYAVLREAGRDRFRSFASRVLAPFRWDSVDERQDWQGDAAVVGLGPISIITMQNQGTRMHAVVPPVDAYYDVHLIRGGGSSLAVGGESISLANGMGAVVSPRMRLELTSDEGYDQFHVRIERSALERHLERALGRPIIDPLRFDVRLDLTAQPLENWARAVGLLVDDLGTEAERRALDARFAAWGDLLIAKLLHAQPHNYSDELARRAGAPPITRRVKRVVDHVMSQPEADFRLAELAAIASVTPRQLQRDFQEHLGVRPLEFIERVRLERAHADLVAGEMDTVAAIAHRWGFAHVPRFAAKYRARYGESPAGVLRLHRSLD